MAIGGAAFAALGVAALALSSVAVATQESASQENAASVVADAPAQLTEPVAPTAEPTPAATVIPAGTTIVIQLDAPVTSRTAIRGDMFPISLVEPVRLNGAEVIPSGIRGEGQVVHSAGTGFGGRAGELIVAARYLQWGDRRIALRGMRISTAGRSATVEALAVSAVIPLGGLFITGTSVDLVTGQIAVAKLAEDIVLASPSDRPSPVVIQQGE